MSVATTTLSSKGQIVIPREIRDQLQWCPGTRITLLPSASGVTLMALPSKSGRRLEDLVGMLKHNGPPLSDAELCAPVDISENRRVPEPGAQ